MLKHAPMFKRIKVWKKYKGNVPAMGVGQTRGQAAVIQRGTWQQADRRDCRTGWGRIESAVVQQDLSWFMD